MPVRATREGPPQAAQVGEWDGPSFETLRHQENYCESGKLCQDINVIDLIPIWTILVTYHGGRLSSDVEPGSANESEMSLHADLLQF